MSNSRNATRSPVERAESKLAKPVQQLMELIFNQDFFAETMVEMNYDADKLPLGYVVVGVLSIYCHLVGLTTFHRQLSKRTLQQGLEALKEIGELLGMAMMVYSSVCFIH